MNKTESARKKMSWFLALGMVCLAGGIVLMMLHAGPAIIPVTMVGLSGALIAMVIATKGGMIIRDEMSMRIDILSGYYTLNATLYFIFILAIIHFFISLPLSISGLLLTLMFSISLTFILIRAYLLRRGKAE